MKRLTLLVAVCSLGTMCAAEDRRFPLDDATSPGLQVTGPLQAVNGVDGPAVLLNGGTVLQEPEGNAFGRGDDGFTVRLWVNQYLPNGEQQMLVARNRYSVNEREWGVMIDRDRYVRLYVWQGKWVTVESATQVKPGHWNQVVVVHRGQQMELWVDGKHAGTVPLHRPLPVTQAPLTVGAVNDNGRVWQNFVGAIDQLQLRESAESESQIRASYEPVAAVHEVPPQPRSDSVAADSAWQPLQQLLANEQQMQVLFDGHSPDKLACDTTLRRMPDGSLVLVMLGNGDTEPLPANRVLITRSTDDGRTWSEMQPIDLGIKAENPETALVPSELMVLGNRCTLFVATHDGTFAGWREWMTTSDDSCRTWGPLQPAPGRLGERTFIRNHIVTRDGRLLLPFQHYLSVGTTREINGGRRLSPPTNPRNGVLMSEDGGTTWTEYGDIRLSPDDSYSGWAENNIVELSGGRIGMIIRGDRLGGVLYYAESADGGRTWPEFAQPTSIPNPGSKATLYWLGDDRVALLHNPNAKHRSPLSLWISFDGMQTWPWQQVLVPQSVDGPQGRLNYPDGFVTEDRRWLDFAFDDNRHRAVRVRVRLPDPQLLEPLADPNQPVPRTADLPVIGKAQFSVIKPWVPQQDGYHWLHGVALEWHRDHLFCVFGHNTGAENTVTEVGRWCVSNDGGRSWSEPLTIDAGEEQDDLAISHGVMLNHDDQLWAFLGAFHGTRERVHTRAYLWEPNTQQWERRGVVVDGGFWPMNQPVRMSDGNWIMPGFLVGDGNPAAVAISKGDDLLSWTLVRIPPAAGLGQMWGESSLIVGDEELTCIGRYGQQPLALVSRSRDGGHTWTAMSPCSLPMTTSKPAAGMLSNGQRYLIASSTADGGGRRSPLTISLSRPGERQFSRTMVIRHAEHVGPGESHPRSSLAYPYAIEREGKLYVGYSNSGGRGGNQNSAELAIIPLSELE